MAALLLEELKARMGSIEKGLQRLFVITCMDERIPINELLSVEERNAHIFRNAGGLVTDDAIRSAMLSIKFFGTKEIFIINHTECRMMTATGESIVEHLRAQHTDLEHIHLNPALPELKLEDPQKNLAKWIQTFTNLDATCLRQVELMRSSQFIPQDVIIHGYIWDIENRLLRRPVNQSSNS